MPTLKHEGSEKVEDVSHLETWAVRVQYTQNTNMEVLKPSEPGRQSFRSCFGLSRIR